MNFRSGELHYPRIPREYWASRLAMARAMGLDTISSYVFWNVHEPKPERYDFTGGYDVAEFVRQAARAGLAVILRPGPYVCAEWDFGGLPAWLLADGAIPIRTTDERYMAPVRRWLHRLGSELAPLQRARGGPIVAIQLENEYGAFGSDAAYLQGLRAALRDAGFGETPLFTIDQPQDLERGSLPDLPVAATFAPGNAERNLDLLAKLRPQQRLAVGEYWAGWFDHWGEARTTVDASAERRDVEYFVANGVNFNVYMFHGGTNFGFSNGANSTDERPYQPDVTSYDYQAALDEAGRPTEKYYAFRRALGCEIPLPPVPQTIAIPRFELHETAPLADLLVDPVELTRPKPMEALGQSFGFVCYRTILRRGEKGLLDVGTVRDFAVVMVDGIVAGTLDRRTALRGIEIEAPTGARVDILVENCGRINYGPDVPDERKGILGAVTLDGRELDGWLAYRLPLDSLARLRFDGGRRRAPVFLRGTFDCAEPGDTFLDVRALGKGVLFVNGWNAGRYWNIGPQASLYVPGVRLRPGRNVVVAFQTVDGGGSAVSGLSEPIVV